MTTREEKQRRLAVDVAHEIICGCKRLTLQGFNEIVNKEGFNSELDSIRQQTRNCIKNWQALDESGRIVLNESIEKKIDNWYGNIN